MGVMGPTEVMVRTTNGTTNQNGCCGEDLFLRDVDRFEVHTGNISHWSSLKRKSTQNPATEVSTCEPNIGHEEHEMPTSSCYSYKSYQLI